MSFVVNLLGLRVKSEEMHFSLLLVSLQGASRYCAEVTRLIMQNGWLVESSEWQAPSPSLPLQPEAFPESLPSSKYYFFNLLNIKQPHKASLQ